MPSPSRADLAKVHIAKKELGLDDETYRDILHWKFNVTSAKDLKPRQVTVLLNHFKSIGWEPKRPRKAGRKPSTMTSPRDKKRLMAKIEAHLAERGLPWAYADGMAKRICKVERVEFCDAEKLHKIVAAFQYDSRRKGLPAE